VNDVGESVPVGDVLRILGAEYDAVPQFDIAALADRLSAHGKEDDRSRREDENGNECVASARNHPISIADSPMIQFMPCGQGTPSAYLVHFASYHNVTTEQAGDAAACIITDNKSIKRRAIKSIVFVRCASKHPAL
jgi:hypothetical protein